MEKPNTVESVEVGSDIGLLKKVIVHRPDPGIEWVTPSNADQLLYDDIVFLPQMIHQHQRFVQVLTAVLGEKSVVEFQKLLEEVLEDPKVKASLVELVVAFEKLDKKADNYLKKLPPMSLSAVTTIPRRSPWTANDRMSPLTWSGRRTEETRLSSSAR